MIDLYGKSSADRRDLLGRLLRAPRMARTWKSIERARLKQIEQLGYEPGSFDPGTLAFTYSGLWGAIQTAFKRANSAEARRKAGKPSFHSEAREHARQAAKMASSLAEHIEKDGALDYLAHTLFRNDVERLALRALRDADLHSAGVSLANTTFVELLIEFQRRALASAPPPIVMRVRARKEAEKDTRPLTFLRELHEMYFKHRLDGPMFAAEAAIATVALNLPPHLEITGDDARRALVRKSDHKRSE